MATRAVDSWRFRRVSFGMLLRHKFSRAWEIAQGHLGATLPALWLQPEGPVYDAELLRVHTEQCLQSQRSKRI